MKPKRDPNYYFQNSLGNITKPDHGVIGPITESEGGTAKKEGFGFPKKAIHGDIIHLFEKDWFYDGGDNCWFEITLHDNEESDDNQ